MTTIASNRLPKPCCPLSSAPPCSPAPHLPLLPIFPCSPNVSSTQVQYRTLFYCPLHRRKCQSTAHCSGPKLNFWQRDESRYLQISHGFVTWRSSSSGRAGGCPGAGGGSILCLLHSIELFTLLSSFLHILHINIHDWMEAKCVCGTRPAPCDRTNVHTANRRNSEPKPCDNSRECLLAFSNIIAKYEINSSCRKTN